MASQYVDSIPPQIARVIGGWTLGFGIVLFLLTFREVGSVHPPRGTITASVLLGVGGPLLYLGSRRRAHAERANRLFFSENAGTEILAQRRARQRLLETVRFRFLLTVVAVSACWLILAGGYTCAEEVCDGFVPGQGFLIDVFMWLFVVAGLITLVIGTLARVHGNETDRWEELASDYLRRRDDGALPGSKASRWE